MVGHGHLNQSFCSLNFYELPREHMYTVQSCKHALLLENAWSPKTHTINLDQDPYIMLHLSRLYLNNHILMVAGRSTIVESSTFSLALQQFHFNKSILILIILTHIPHLLLLSPYSTSPQVHWSFQVFFSCFELVTPISSPCSCMLVFTYLNSHSFFM